MPRSLVTGATGFVGSNLVAHLLGLGQQVRCLVRDMRRAAPLESLGAELSLGELNDPSSLGRAVEGVDIVYHVAGRVRAFRSQQFITDNVEGTRNLAVACAEGSTPPGLVVVSSIAAGGPSRPGYPRKESDEDRPISAYGESKLAAERAAAKFAGQVPVSIIRPPIIFGPADRASLAIFRGVQWTRIHPVPGFRKFPVSLVHVFDLCAALVRVAESGQRVPVLENGKACLATGTYHVASERTVGYGELGLLAAQSLGFKAIALPTPKALFWMVGGLAELLGQIRRKPGLLNLDKIREAVAPGWECSDKKIRAELDYKNPAVLEERFAETAAWYREHGWI